MAFNCNFCHSGTKPSTTSDSLFQEDVLPAALKSAPARLTNSSRAHTGEQAGDEGTAAKETGTSCHSGTGAAAGGGHRSASTSSSPGSARRRNRMWSGFVSRTVARFWPTINPTATSSPDFAVSGTAVLSSFTTSKRTSGQQQQLTVPVQPKPSPTIKSSIQAALTPSKVKQSPAVENGAESVAKRRQTEVAETSRDAAENVDEQYGDSQNSSVYNKPTVIGASSKSSAGMTTRDISSTTAADADVIEAIAPAAYYIIDVKLKEGRDLVIKDSCGTSDPYVKFKVGGKQLYRSRTIFKNLNPRWDERFILRIDDVTKPVKVKVYDYDRGLTDDAMGQAVILPRDLPLNEPTDLKLLLSEEKKSRSAKETPYMGYLLLECTLVPQTQDEVDKTTGGGRRLPRFRGSSCGSGDAKRIQQWNSVVTIALIEGRDLVAMDDNGLSDPYVKFKLGTERYKTKYKLKTLNPRWMEQFDLYIYDDHSRQLEIAVFDRDKGGRDEVMGSVGLDQWITLFVRPKVRNIDPAPRLTGQMYGSSCCMADRLLQMIICLDRGRYCRYSASEIEKTLSRAIVELSGLEMERTHNLNVALEDGAGILNLLITISGQQFETTLSSYRTATADRRRQYDFQNSFSNMDEVGLLAVKVIRAQGLSAADLGGKSDPYCVLELVNNRLQTHTIYKTLSPEWHKQFVFPVYDVHSVLEITVYDEDRDKKVEFLGKVAVPLLRVNNDERKWYALKDHVLCQPVKGSIELEMNLVYNPIKAAFKTFKPREVKIMQPEPKFGVATMKHNILRVQNIVEGILNFGKFLQSCFDWESKTRSLCAFSVFVTFVWNFELYMIPVTLIIIFIKNLVVAHLFGDTLAKDKLDYDYVDDEDDEDDDKREKSEKTQSLRERFQSIQDVCLQVQESMDVVACLFERIKNVFSWAEPWLAVLAIIVMLVVTTILYCMPLRYLILIWGINKFTKKLRAPNDIDNNEILDFLSRVPSDKELVKYRELRVEPQTTPAKKKLSRPTRS